MPLRNLPGGVPEPEELIGRDHLIQVLWDQLRGNNILLVAPRRFGKTGIMRHVLKRPQLGYIPVYFDAEELSEPAKFAAELVVSLLQHDKLRSLAMRAKHLPSDLLKKIAGWVEEAGTDVFRVKLRGALADSWEHVARELILEMEKADDTVVFIIDEFPQFLENVSRKLDDEAARSFLTWFRSLRMRQKDQLRRFRFIIGGSTGVDVILRRLEVPDKLNDFFRLPVEPLSRADGEVLLRGLAETYGIGLTPEAVDVLFQLIGPPVPNFIHLFVSQILLDREVKGRNLSADDIRAIYRDRLLGPTCRFYFDYYRRRLKRYGAEAERAAITILREIANAPSGKVSDSALYDAYLKARKKGASQVEFLEILADLESDWYVALDTATNEYFFRLEVMRAWWRRFYRPVAPKRSQEDRP